MSFGSQYLLTTAELGTTSSQKLALPLHDSFSLSKGVFYETPKHIGVRIRNVLELAASFQTVGGGVECFQTFYNIRLLFFSSEM